MKSSCFLKSCSMLAAALLFTGSIFTFVPLTVSSESTPVLSIEQVKVTEEEFASGRSVAVDVSIRDNPDGFLATSFGIQYDSALVFEDAVAVNAAGYAHAFAHNPDTSLLWFSGADTSGSSSANMEAEEVMFTLTFTIPEDAAVGSSYPISFCWTMANGKQGYWHLPSHTNVIGGLQGSAVNGSISVPDPNAAALSSDSLQVAVGGTQTLSLLNYAGSAAWISDNTSIATVDNGIVTGIAPGTCTVYAMLENTMLTCSITVTKEAYYDISQTDIVYLTDPEQIVILECPADAGNSVNWISDNTNVVTVSGGQLTGIQNGTASVYAITGGSIYNTHVVVAFPQAPTGTGDVTLDGSVDILDVIKLNRSILAGDHLTESQRSEGDVNRNNSLDLSDSLNILKHVIGMVESLPVN